MPLSAFRQWHADDISDTHAFHMLGSLPYRKPLLQLTVGMSKRYLVQPLTTLDCRMSKAKQPVGSGSTASVSLHSDTWTIQHSTHAIKAIHNAEVAMQEIAAIRCAGFANSFNTIARIDCAFTSHTGMSLLCYERLYDTISSRMSVIKSAHPHHIFTKQLTKASLQLLSAVSCTHSRRISHLDIKPANLLCYYQDDRSVRLKLCDFGNALPFSAIASLASHPDVQTPSYRAPEVALGSGPSPIASDSWSCGVVLAEVALSQQLFSARTSRGLLEEQSRVLGGRPPQYAFPDGEISLLDRATDLSREWRRRARCTLFTRLRSAVGLEYASLVLRLLHHDPSQRLSASSALSQPPVASLGSHKAPPVAVEKTHPPEERERARFGPAELKSPLCDAHARQCNHHQDPPEREIEEQVNCVNQSSTADVNNPSDDALQQQQQQQQHEASHRYRERHKKRRRKR